MKYYELDVVFKDVVRREAGKWTNDKGEVLSYDASYVIVCDIKDNETIHERRLKFPVENKKLFGKLSSFDEYTKITLLCSVILYTGNAKVVPVDVKDISHK